jgi:hypothetical protein
MSDIPLRFPKVHSPFEREENESDEYVVFDSVNDGYEWVFENDDVIAVEKLDGTNCAVEMGRDSHSNSLRPVESYTRHGTEPFQVAKPYGDSGAHRQIVRAVQNSMQRGYLRSLDEGVHYGEAVGPAFQANRHELKENLFIPFSWLADKCLYKSWGKYQKNFETIRGWFEEDLFSLFYSRMHGCDLDESSVSNGTFCEGIMFVHPDNQYNEAGITTEEESLSGGTYRKVCPTIAKLRRDMFAGAKSEWPGPVGSH